MQKITYNGKRYTAYKFSELGKQAQIRAILDCIYDFEFF